MREEPQELRRKTERGFGRGGNTPVWSEASTLKTKKSRRKTKLFRGRGIGVIERFGKGDGNFEKKVGEGPTTGGGAAKSSSM